MQLKYLSVIGLASFLVSGCCTKHPSSLEWEYKVVRLSPTQQDFEAQLNVSAKGGWKLLTSVPAEGGANSGYNQYVFQRPKL
jgi:hypothetical protein